MKQYIKHALALALILGLFSACNKEDLDAEKAIQIIVNGYNGGTNALQMSIDTTQYDATVAYGAYLMQPDAPVDKNLVYTYRSDKKRTLTLTDVVTKKVVFTGTLPTNATSAAFYYVFIDGKELEIQRPVADANTNKLGFYLHYNTSTDPIDIFLYRRNNSTGQEFRTYLAKNVRPGQWVYVNYAATENFGTKGFLGNSSVYLTKAGTIDQWAFDDDQNKSIISANSMFLPITNEKGLVQPYFITPKPYNGGLSNLFFYPER